MRLMAWFMMALLLLAGGFLFLIAPGRRCRKERPAALMGWDYAHRGLHDGNARVMENSLAAFRLAAEAGYGIELDVRLTADQKLVVYHDGTLARLCGVNRSIIQMTLEELKHDAPFVPTLDEVLDAVAGRCPLILELKSHKIGDTALAALVHARMQSYPGPYCVESFDPMQMRWYKRNARQVIRGQLLWGKMGKRAFPHILAHVLSRPDFVAYPIQMEKSPSFRLMRALFHPMLVGWTVRTQEDYERLQRQCDLQIFEVIRPPARAGQRQ